MTGEVAHFISNAIEKDFKDKGIELSKDYYDLLRLNLMYDNYEPIQISIVDILEKKSREEIAEKERLIKTDPLRLY